MKHEFDKDVTPISFDDLPAALEDGGVKEIDLTGLSGLLADDQHVLDAEVLAVAAALVHAARHTDGDDDIQDATAGQKGLATAAQITKLDGIEASANNTPASYSRQILSNAFQFPDPVNGWVPALGGAYLVPNKAAKYLYLPVSGLAVGDIIKSYTLVGDAVISGTSTLDCKIIRLNKDNPPTTTDLTNGAITQVTADGIIDSTANNDDETVATDKQYALVILATTDVADSFTLIGAEFEVTRLI